MTRLTLYKLAAVCDDDFLRRSPRLAANGLKSDKTMINSKQIWHLSYNQIMFLLISVNLELVGENGHAFFNCDLHGVLKFSQLVGVVPWYLPLRFGRGAEVSPRWNLWGVAFPPGITNIFKKSHL